MNCPGPVPLGIDNCYGPFVFVRMNVPDLNPGEFIDSESGAIGKGDGGFKPQIRTVINQLQDLAGSEPGLFRPGRMDLWKTVEYTSKIVTDGHRYVVWESEGEKFFMSVSPTEAHTNLWADITFVDGKKKTINSRIHPLSSQGHWDQNAVIKIGDTVKSVSCAIAAWKNTGSAIAMEETFSV